MLLTTAPIITFLATANAKRAKVFYRDVLKLKLSGEDEFALVFEIGKAGADVLLRVVKVDEPTIAPYTVLGWHVTDMAQAVRTLRRRGVRFQKYKGMRQDKSGVWTSPSGAKVAWFKDPDGNTLSLTQLAAA